MTDPYYRVLSSAVSIEFEEKKSRFLGFLYPAQTREIAFSHLDTLKQTYPDARHHCWAYLFGDPNQPKTQAFNDDGEPSGTAGKPILHVLTQRGCGDTMAIVVRYFGGIKLGAGGLVRAYSSAVSQAIDQADFTERRPLIQLQLTLPFALESIVRRLIDDYDGNIQELEYSHEVTLRMQLESNRQQSFSTDIQQLSSGSVIVKTLND
ncbi:YigZ family protein [Gynuella sp.]|uniref:YigZ family protein n=1 Tax=Gynuella sp. TaxID=2969146 RepID=UPI003D1506D9